MISKNILKVPYHSRAKLAYLVSQRAKRRTFYLGLTIFFLFTLLPSLFLFLSPGALPSSLTLVSAVESTNILQIDKGRFRVKGADDQGPIQLHFEGKDLKNAHWLMVRRQVDPVTKEAAPVKITFPDGQSRILEKSDKDLMPREFIPYKLDGKNELTLTIEREKETTFIFSEIGFFQKNPSFFSPSVYPYVKLIAKGLTILLALFGMYLLDPLLRKKTMIYALFLVFSLSLFSYMSITFAKFYPEWSQDLRVALSSGNFNEEAYHSSQYGTRMAQSILAGNGPLVDNSVPWCRMPGYGFLLSLLGGPNSLGISELLAYAVKAVQLQIGLLIGALCLLFYFAAIAISPKTALLGILGILLLPSTNLFLVIVEGIMPAVVVYCLATSCKFIRDFYLYGRKKIPLTTHIFLHSGFALWFFMRTDVIPAWIIVSLILYGRSLKKMQYLLVPTFMFLMVGIPWGLFKVKQGLPFNMTTESVGASFMKGLWEIPNKFSWEPDDASYFSWMREAGFDPISKEGSVWAAKESFRFCLTYPFYLICLMLHKFIAMLHQTDMDLVVMVFIMIPVAALFSTNRKNLTLLLSWPFLLNMPIFFIFYSSGGRFYIPAYISMVFSTTILLCDRDFYTMIDVNYKRALIIFLTGLFFAFWVPKVDNFLINNSNLLYYSPFFNPSSSSLVTLGNNPKKQIDE